MWIWNKQQRINRLLMARERNQQCLERTLKPGQAGITFILNVPGINKQHPSYTIFFNNTLKLLKQFLLTNNIVIIGEIINDAVYDWALLTCEGEPETLKQLLLDFENHQPQAACLDLDVYFWTNDKLSKISRSALGLAPRRCFVCDQPAKACARSQTHTYHELIKHVNKTIK